MRLRRRKPLPEHVSQAEVVAKPKRSWKSRLGEFLLWTLVALATAVIMISMSETLLPSNF